MPPQVAKAYFTLLEVLAHNHTGTLVAQVGGGVEVLADKSQCTVVC